MVKSIFFTVPTLKTGGQERALVNFASELSNQGIIVRIYVLSGNQNFYNLPPKIKVYYGKKVYKYRIKNQIIFFYSLIKLRILCKKLKPDYIFSFSGRHSSYIVITLLGLNLKTFIFHRSSPLKKYGFVDEFLRKTTYPLAEGLIAQTNMAKELLSKKFKPKRIFVVPNPVRKIQITNYNQRKKVIVSVSRLVKGKRVDLLIDIFSRSETDNWELLIIGDGNQKIMLTEQVKALGIQSKVKFVGETNDVDYYLSLASIFAFTSESEGFPNALLEAMCSGLACISFDCIAGPQDIIKDNINGFLIENENVKEYQYKLNRLMMEEETRVRLSNEALKLNFKHEPKNIVEKLISDISS